jgi:hypothetical protein
MPYRIIASYQKDGQTFDCSDDVVLGPAYGATYSSKIRAKLAAGILQESIQYFGLDPSTTYSVEEVTR